MEHDPAVSPDGRWIAYVSDESGEHEVWVRRYPEGGSRVKVSTGTGDNPIWSPDGLEIIYPDDDRLWSTPMTVEGEVIRAGTPVMIAELLKSYSWNFDISRDGKRLLFIRSQNEETGQLGHPTIVLNWFEEFRNHDRR